MNIILFGPYGCGKGTQGKILAEKYSLASFDAGNELRKHIKSESNLGLKIKEIVNRGDLVSDDVIMEVVSSFIDNNSGGYLFDGIPRTQVQANLLDKLLLEKAIEVKRIFINIPKELSIARQVGRKSCQKCGAIYPASYEGDLCAKCGAVMEKRSENDRAIASKRTAVYEEETLPLIKNYLDKDLLYEIDGTQSIEEVSTQILNYLE